MTHYQKHKEYYQNYNRKYQKKWAKSKKGKTSRKKLRDARRAFIILEKDKPCCDCGKHFPWYVMDFDHVKGTKIFEIGLGTNRAISSIKKEIAKCDLVCANCHRIRTFEILKKKNGVEKLQNV